MMDFVFCYSPVYFRSPLIVTTKALDFKSEGGHSKLLLLPELILLLLLTAIELSLSGSSPYTSTDKTRIHIHKQNKSKNTHT
jgi:hypothetical protein